MTIDHRIPVTEELNMLEELLAQNQFERADPATEDPHARTDLRVVYLMNDAAESFLIFRDCLVNGPWPREEGSPIEASLSRQERGYCLILRQEGSVTTLFFRALEKEVHLYNYAALGHFWVKDWEYLRNLEYHLAILRDKRDYLGEDCCNALELELAKLTEFPPLNYCCYPSAPAQYVVPAYPEWKVSQAALEAFGRFAAEVNDVPMLRLLLRYRHFPTKGNAKKIARLLRTEPHAALTDLLLRRVREASAVYPDRSFSDPACHALNRKAEARQKELEAQGIRAEIVREEPFTAARDSVEYHVYLMKWGMRNILRTVEIEEIRE